jgi:hypothetical protein
MLARATEIRAYGWLEMGSDKALGRVPWFDHYLQVNFFLTYFFGTLRRIQQTIPIYLLLLIWDTKDEQIKG